MTHRLADPPALAVTSMTSPRVPGWSRVLPSFGTWRTWVALLAGAAASVVLALLMTLLAPQRVTVRASFAPVLGRAPTAMGGLAAQLALNLGTAEPLQSPALFADLALSDEILRRVDTALIARSQSLHGIPVEQRARRLRSTLRAVPVGRTGIVVLTGSAVDSVYALAVVTEALRALNDFSRHLRSEQARNDREFAQGQLADAAADLRSAERRLAEFLERNRSVAFGLSPALAQRRGELERDVESNRSMLQSLMMAFQQAKFEELRNTPTITVLERPAMPLVRPPRLSIPALAFATVFGGAVAYGMLALVAWRRTARPSAASVPADARR